MTDPLSTNPWFEKLARPRKRLRAAFLRGWDAAIAGRNACPYSRRDFADRWRDGYQACMAGEDLPSWAKPTI